MSYSGAFAVGIVIGFISGAVSSSMDANRNAGYYECIKGLPRTQDCKLIAVPINGVVDWQDMPDSN